MSSNPNPVLTEDSIEKLDYETPFFLLSKNKVIGKYEEFKKAYPGADIYYAMKANFEPEILSTLRDEGSGFEIASAYELRMLKDLDIPADRIIYGTSVKATSHIKEAYDYGVNRFAFDSSQELERIAAVAPGSKVFVRILADDTGSIFRLSKKFGTHRDNAVPLLHRAKELGLHPYGISFHVGSQASNPRAWAKAIEQTGEIMTELKELGITIDIINLGGGYPCAYASSDVILSTEEIAKHTLEEYEKLPYQPKIILEPGRGIAATSCIAVASVIARLEREGGPWLFLDMGVYNGLFESMAYQGSTRYRTTMVRPSLNAGEMLFTLAGPTGDSPDIITHEAHLPNDISVGDKIIFHDVGAYNLPATCPFNGFPKPDVHIL